MIENKASHVFEWFSNNYLKSNPDKSHLLLTSISEISIQIEGCIIKTNTSRKLLGVIIDHKLNFTEYVSKLCKKQVKNSMLLHEFHVLSPQVN